MSSGDTPTPDVYGEYGFASISAKQPVRDRLSDLRPDDETWTEFLDRLAEIEAERQRRVEEARNSNPALEDV